jgi:hypothetical protein
MSLSLNREFVAILISVSALLGACSEKGSFVDKSVGSEDLVGEANDQNGAGGHSADIPGSLIASDLFYQSIQSKLDVLWVIDNSVSMAPYQQLLAENIDQFLDEASSWNADMQMAVTSTDMCQSIRPNDPALVYCPDRAEARPGLQGRIAGRQVVYGLDASARDQFARLAKLGTSGSSFEHGLSAAKAAVKQSLAGLNGDLVRNDAFLSVVIVSDEEDDGVGLSMPDEGGHVWTDTGLTKLRFTAADLVSYLSSVKPDGKFSVSSVVGFKSRQFSAGGCRNGHSLEVGAEQSKAADLSGGFKLDICTDDWASGLSAMAGSLTAQMSAFKLSKVPENASSIQIFVDGTLITSGWRYIEGRQSVVFDVDALPPYGSQIEIKYAY